MATDAHKRCSMVDPQLGANVAVLCRADSELYVHQSLFVVNNCCLLLENNADECGKSGRYMGSPKQ